MAASFVRQEEKRRFGVGARPRREREVIENAVNQNAVHQNAVHQNAVGQNAVGQNAVNQNAVNQNAVNQNAVNQNAVNQNAVNQNAVNHARIETKQGGSAERGTPPGGVASFAEPAKLAMREARQVPGGRRKRGRYLAAAVRRDVHGRDQGRCAFVSAGGRRCGAQAFLEFDHIEPYARFGSTGARNIRLLCRAHNLLHARSCFGALHVAAKIAARKRAAPPIVLQGRV